MKKIKKNIQQQLDKEKPAKLVIGSLEKPEIEIQRFEVLEGESLEEIQLSNHLRSKLSLIMQQAPSLVLNTANVLSNSYELVLSPEAIKGLSNGTITLMKSAEGGFRASVIHTKSGKIFEQGRLKALGGVNPAAFAFAIWQVATVVTGQKFLAEINKHLINIEADINSIIEFLERQEKGKLIANYKRIREIYDALFREDLGERDIDTFISSIDRIDYECSQILESIELGIHESLVRMKGQNLSGKSLDEHYNWLHYNIIDYEDKLTPYLMSAYVRICVAQLQCALLCNKNIALNHTKEIGEKIDSLKKGSLDFFTVLVLNRIPRLTGNLFDSIDKETNYRNSLGNEAVKIIEKFNDNFEEVKVAITLTKSNIENHFKEQNEPLRINVVLDDMGGIIEASKIVRNNIQMV